jgi:hypothetical protein
VRLRRVVLPLCVLGALVVGVAAALADPRSWSIVPSPSPDTVSSLHDVSFAGQKEGWAVGLRGPSEGGPFTQLSEHWDGSAWTVVPMPSVGDTSALGGVAAIGRDDAWAVGFSVTAGFSDALIDHWDGLSWSVEPAPFAGGDEATLDDVAALSSNDVWAAGYLSGGGPEKKPILEHWDGLAWNLVVPPAVGDQSLFFGIDAAAPDDIWAVGWSVADGVKEPLTEHWDGSAWSIVPVPSPGGESLFSVTAGRDVWAVGEAEFGPTGPVKTVAEHWDGHAWTRVATPNPGSQSVLLGVAETSAHDVWAVGDTNSIPGGIAQPLIEHFDGGTWSVVPPGLRDDGGFLEAVKLFSPAKGIAVGATKRIPPTSPLSDFTLVEQLSAH